MLFNLISNAIKFTQEGGVTVRLWSVPRDPLMVKCEVQDTGIGIKPEDIPKMFKIYGKLEDSKKINHKGVGLGLYITK